MNCDDKALDRLSSLILENSKLSLENIRLKSKLTEIKALFYSYFASEGDLENKILNIMDDILNRQ